jgi:hypothetical protein
MLMIRAPVAPNGWPSAVLPPFGFMRPRGNGPKSRGTKVYHNTVVQPQGLSGAIDANFSGTGSGKNATADLQVHGDQLKYQGLLIQNVNAEVTVRNSKAEVQTCRVTLDAKNHLELRGTAELADPYPYVLNGKIDY